MNKHNFDIEKIRREYSDGEEFIIRQLQDEEFQKEFLSDMLNDYLEDGDFKPFFRALEMAVKARCSVTKFCADAEIERTNFYSLIRGDKKPKLETVLKIFKALGFELRVA